MANWNLLPCTIKKIDTTHTQIIQNRGGRFRQTGFSGGNIIVGTVLGIISGKYIFEEPLQHYWAEKHAAEQIAAGKGGDGAAAGSTKQ